jgi:hypothetical protein
MAQVIQVENPFTTGLATAENEYNSESAAKDKAAALARSLKQQEFENNLKTHEASNDDQRLQMQIQRNKFDEDSQSKRDAIDAAVEKSREILFPLMQKQAELQNQYTKGMISYQDAQRHGAVLDNQLKSVNLEITKKYGPQAAALANQKTAADIAAENASATASYASADLMHQEAAHVGDKYTTGLGGNSGKLDRIMDNLSPNALTVWKQISDQASGTAAGGAKINRAGAMLMLRQMSQASPGTKPILSAKDVEDLTAIIQDKSASPVQSNQQIIAGERADANKALRVNYHDAGVLRSSGEAAYQTLTSHIDPAILSKYAGDLATLQAKMRAGATIQMVRDHLASKRASDPASDALYSAIFEQGQQ